MSKRPILLLLLGTAAGIAAAALGLLDGAPAARSLPADAVARVNDAIIRREDYERVLDAAAQDRREPLDAAMRRHVLDRLIEEELLVQRGLELGLAEHDRKVRTDLSMAMITSVTEEYAELAASEDELGRFYDDNRDFFAGPGRLRLRQVFVRVPRGSDADAALARALEAARRLRAGEPIAELRGALGDQEFAPVPDTLLPPAKLRDYIGPTAVQAALRLPEGGVSEPVRSSMGFHVLEVIERQPDQAPALEEIRPQVLAEYRRRAGEQALRLYLDELRQRARVEIVEPEP